jgi:hypothetical protein
MATCRVLIVGYPKSGNTWLTRLTADLVAAPVRGFWGEPHTVEMAVEGLTRRTALDVYKGHHAHAAAARDFGPTDLIYVVRDVRDVALSAAHYFSFRRRTKLGRLTHFARRVRERISGQADTEFRVRRMLQVLDEGDAGVSPWCARPWDEHVRGYLDAGAFVIRYEDLLRSPEQEAGRLLRHLGIDRSMLQIRAAIGRQSFVAAKQRFLAAGDLDRAAFLRAGRAGAWRATLTAEHQASCWQRFGPVLERLGYGKDGIDEVHGPAERFVGPRPAEGRPERVRMQ